ncbi:MAG: RDD family protein [Acidimicrobiales bacterium]
MSTTTPHEGRPSEGGPASWPPPASPDPGRAFPSYPAPPPGSEPPPPIAGVPALPPGVTLAPVGRRIGAYFLSIVLVIVTLVIGYVVWGLIVWGRGTTPALSVLKMRCVKVRTGRKATFGTMALREIVGRIAEGILGWITLLVSLILFLARADHRCLHDLIAGTVVVYDPEGHLDSVP